MHFHGIPTQDVALKAHRHRHTSPPPGQASVWQQPLSRRQFTRTAAGTAVVGATLGAGVWRPRLAHARQPHEPIPIPGGSPTIQTIFGQTFHVFGPGPSAGVGVDPIDAEPATITDFNGLVGLAYLNGTVRQINTTTGEIRILPFLGTDIRFMKGVFRDTTGQLHHGAFALV
jgi:hypothetical protein